ncbi:hypothetical protein [Shewanella sp.]|uniref:hypothetical protein n=1 Tax=Shewanella sp. TaxID=50422 RepID=UPI003A8ADEBE
MTRRYLTIEEANSALHRGKLVEIFIGGFTLNDERCIRWASFAKTEKGISGSLWEVYDQGSEDYLDIYTFDSPTGEYHEPVKVVHSENIENATKELGISSLNFVNQGVVQDEYGSYLLSHI